MLVVVYEGSPGDPMDQTMRLVRAADLEDALRRHPHAISAQKLETPLTQEPPDIGKLRRGTRVWSY